MHGLTVVCENMDMKIHVHVNVLVLTVATGNNPTPSYSGDKNEAVTSLPLSMDQLLGEQTMS